MFCPKCGREIDDKAVMCVWCGNQVKPLNEKYKEDAPSKLCAALGFFFPIVGLILYLVENDKTPKKARSAGRGAIAGFAVWCAISLILVALYVVGIMSIVNSFVFESGGSEHTYDYSYNTDADEWYYDDGWYYDGEYTDFNDEWYYGDEFADVIIEGCFTGENGGVNILVANKTDYTADFVVAIEAVDGNGRTLAADSTAVVALIPGDVASAYMLGDFTEDLTADDVSDIEFRVVSVICEPRA